MPAEKRTPTAGPALGQAIRAAREEGGYTPEMLAARISVDLPFYESIERGDAELSLDVIVQIATALESSASELFERAAL